METCERCNIVPSETWTVDMSPPSPVCGVCADIVGDVSITATLLRWKHETLARIGGAS